MKFSIVIFFLSTVFAFQVEYKIHSAFNSSIIEMECSEIQAERVRGNYFFILTADSGVFGKRKISVKCEDIVSISNFEDRKTITDCEELFTLINNNQLYLNDADSLKKSIEIDKYVQVYGDVNPCDDEIFITVNKIGYENITDRQFEYYKIQNQKCEEYKKHIFDLPARGESHLELNVVDKSKGVSEKLKKNIILNISGGYGYYSNQYTSSDFGYLGKLSILYGNSKVGRNGIEGSYFFTDGSFESFKSISIFLIHEKALRKLSLLFGLGLKNTEIYERYLSHYYYCCGDYPIAFPVFAYRVHDDLSMAGKVSAKIKIPIRTKYYIAPRVEFNYGFVENIMTINGLVEIGMN